MVMNNDARWRRTQERKALVLELVSQGYAVMEALADPRIGVTYSAYRQWRRFDAPFAARMDTIRYEMPSAAKGKTPSDLTSAEFAKLYFNRDRTFFQQMWVDKFHSMRAGDILMALWPPEYGKGWPSGTELPTPTGWTTIDDVAEGDFVLGRDGLPVRVAAVHPWRQLDCYELTFSDGSTATTDGDHLWFVSSRSLRSKRGRYGTTVLNTRSIVHTVLANKRPVLRVPIAAALDLPAIDFGTDPYLLGAWLGDGLSARCGTICAGHQDLDALIGRFISAGYPPDLASMHAPAPLVTNARLRAEIKALGLQSDKHIPAHLLRASWAQRLELLHGLMDTDGSISNGQAEYAGINKRLVDGVYELVRTLGFKARQYEGRAKLNGQDMGPVYRISFFPGSLPVFSLPRKLARQTKPHQGDRQEWEMIVAARPVPSVPTRCIRVEADDSLYLVGRSFIVTHNTSTYEDVATETIARDCNVRLSVASENSKIAQKILGAVRHRLEPGGPTPRLVKEFGPFRPDKGTGAFSMPWNNEEFSVFAKRFSDERDFSMQALGRDSSFVSLRTDWLHVDDPQSTKTIGATQKIIDWFRQDGLARPGESGKTTISMTRVGPDDFAEVLENDEDLHGILHVLKFKAILTDVTTGEQRPLWPEKHTLEQLERMRLKMGQERFDRNYMMDPGASMKNRTFTDDAIAKACNPQRALRELPASVLAGDGRTPAYITLDPALGVGRCSFGVFVPTWEQLLLVDISEEQQFQRNEDIMGHLEMLLYRYSETLRVTDVVIEAMNFQRGLARNSQLLAMRDKWGFQIREHLTGMNKYDENIGIASMAGDFSTGKVELPYAPDATTRSCIDEVISQAKKWKPGARGNKLRQDRLMVIWFAWILWEQRRLAMRPYDDKNLSWKRKGVPWGRTNVGVIIPIGAKL